MIKQLSGFAVISINGIQRVSYTYDEISDAGKLISSNNKKSFFAVEENVQSAVNSISEIIKEKMNAE